MEYEQIDFLIQKNYRIEKFVKASFNFLDHHQIKLLLQGKFIFSRTCTPVKHLISYLVPKLSMIQAMIEFTIFPFLFYLAFSLSNSIIFIAIIKLSKTETFSFLSFKASFSQRLASKHILLLSLYQLPQFCCPTFIFSTKFLVNKGDSCYLQTFYSLFLDNSSHLAHIQIKRSGIQSFTINIKNKSEVHSYETNLKASSPIKDQFIIFAFLSFSQLNISSSPFFKTLQKIWKIYLGSTSFLYLLSFYIIQYSKTLNFVSFTENDRQILKRKRFIFPKNLDQNALKMISLNCQCNQIIPKQQNQEKRGKQMFRDVLNFICCKLTFTYNNQNQIQ